MRRASGKVLLAAVITFFGGLNTAQAADTNTYGATIAIGDIGKVKDSHTIVLRVVTPDDAKPPLLLHRASYNIYADATWRARNVLGAVQIARETGVFSYTATNASEAALDGAPTANDLQLPEKEREAYGAVAAELGLSAQTAAASIERVKYFFATGYQYAPYQKDAAIAGSPMVDFLHRAKAGHCEYFASATVLLLRAGGIPARYATGFAVNEISERQITHMSTYIVRQRHAHAWVRAYVNGAWRDIDTTPPSWIAAEAQGNVWWMGVADLWSWWRFCAWQAWGDGAAQWITGAGIIVLVFAAWLARGLFRRRRTKKNINEII